MDKSTLLFKHTISEEPKLVGVYICAENKKQHQKMLQILFKKNKYYQLLDKQEELNIEDDIELPEDNIEFYKTNQEGWRRLPLYETIVEAPSEN